MRPELSLYQDLLAATDEMRIATGNSEWQLVLALEMHCLELMAALKAAEANDWLATLAKTDQQQLAAIIARIQANEAAIRDRTLPWMAQLRRMMQHPDELGNQMSRAYAQHAP